MKALFRQEASQVINPIVTAAKLRDVTTSFKRHTIRRPIRMVWGDQAQARHSAASTF